MGTFSQIRNRRLFQIVASYLAAGWIAMEVVDQFVERGYVPEMLYELILLAYLCGIPAALIVGWYHGEKGDQHASKPEVAMLGIIGVLFLTLSSFTVRDYRAERQLRTEALEEAGLDMRRIGVMYFDDYSRNGEYRYISDAFTEALIDELARVPALEVTSRNAAGHFRDIPLPRDSVARLLGVGTLVGGIVEERGSGLEITVRLFEGRNGNEFRSATIRTTPEEVLTARDEVVNEVATLLRQALGEEITIRAGGRRMTDPQAWTLLQRAEKARKDAESFLLDHERDRAFMEYARADSLAAMAGLLAPDWTEPIVFQATTAYRRSREAEELHDLLSWADRALKHAERALGQEPNHARALELRGTNKYWKYLMVQDSDPELAARLLVDARRDLEEAVRIEPTLGSGFSTLSHLLVREDLASSVVAARRAYEADAWLQAAPDVLLRLTTGNYDLENFDQAQRWCDEGGRRFPEIFRFTDCQLLLMTTRHVQPDIDRAWHLLAQLDSLSPASRRDYDNVRGLTLVGGVIARVAAAGNGSQVLADSARRVLLRAQDGMTHEVDPQQELLPLIAYMYTLLEDNQRAIALLRRYAAVDPHASYDHHWRWRVLRGLPEFRPLLGS